MSILKKENWFIDLILMITTGGLFSFALAYSLDLYDKKAWYSNYKYWLFGFLCLIFPAMIMFLVFYVQMLVKVNVKLNTPGIELYSIPYFWIICLIIPLVGWVCMLSMLVYLIIWPSIMIKK